MVRWVAHPSGTRLHAFADGAASSLCNQMVLPPDLPKSGSDPPTVPIPLTDPALPRCGSCTRLLAVSEALNSAAGEDSGTDGKLVVESFLELATQLVLGPSWMYAELDKMPTWRESVDRVATALAYERRSALAKRTGT